jgi:hypothetical protein
MPRWLAHACVVVGWLLTPLWAWGASFFGMWLGAHVVLQSRSLFALIAPGLAGAAICGFSTLLIWVRFMRRVPHLLAHHMAPRPSLEQPRVDH